MADDGDHDEHHESYREASGETRATSPMDPFSLRDAGLGALILAIGLLIVFGVPLLLG